MTISLYAYHLNSSDGVQKMTHSWLCMYTVFSSHVHLPWFASICDWVLENKPNSHICNYLNLILPYEQHWVFLDISYIVDMLCAKIKILEILCKYSKNTYVYIHRNTLNHMICFPRSNCSLSGPITVHVCIDNKIICTY